MAAESTDTSAGAPQQTATLSEVVVTSQRIKENLQTVPIAVTSQRGQELEEKGVTNVQNLQFTVPALNVASSPVGGDGAGQVFMRGVGQIDYTLTQEPDVPIYVDGVYLARPVGSLFDFVDVDRVEALRGPQGTLFGRNTLGGAIQVITAAPTPVFGGMLRLTGGNDGLGDAAGMLNLPLSDTLALRVVGHGVTYAGYGRSLPLDRKTNDRRDTDFRAQLKWTPSDSTDVNLRAEHSTHSTEAALQTLTAVNPDALFLPGYNAMLASKGFPQITPASVPANPYVGTSGLRAPDKAVVSMVSLEANQRWGSTAFKSITAYRTVNAHSGFDFAPVPYPYLTETTRTDERQFTQEFQLYGKALSNRLDWIGGAYFFHESNDQPQLTTLLQDISRTGPGPYDFVPTPGTGIVENAELNQTTNSYAVYAQAGYEVLPPFKITLGVRESWDQKRFGSSLGVGDSNSNVRAFGNLSNRWTQFTPKLGLEYTLTDAILAYTSVSKGYRAGGFNGHASGAVPPDSYGPETMWAYEAGLKSEFLDRRLRVNLAGYHYDYRNYQGNENAVEDGAIVVVVQNVANARFDGMELESQFKVSAPLSIGAFLSLETIKFVDILPLATSVRADSQPPNAPRRTAGLNVNYDVQVGDWGSASVRVDGAYKSKTQFFLPNLPGEAQGGYSLLNARLTFVPTHQNLEIALFGKNLTDKRYKTYAQSVAASFGTVLGVYAPPREWGGSVTMRF